MMAFGLFKKKKEEDLGAVGSDLGLGLNSGMNTGLGNSNTGLGNNLGLEPHNDFMQSQNTGFSQPYPSEPTMNLSTMQNQQSMQPQGDMQKDLQIVSLKLDAIKSELDSMNQRIKKIEEIAEKEQATQKKWY